MINPTYIAVLIRLYLPLEDFLLKLLPVSDEGLVFMRFGSELVGYFLLGLVIIWRYLNKGHLFKTPIDVWVAGLILIGFVSTFLNEAPVGDALVQMRAMFRYLAVYYALANWEISAKAARRVLYSILGIGVVEVFLGVFQLIGPESFKSIFLPRAATVEVGGAVKEFVLATKGREAGAIFGSLGDTVLFAEFLLVAFVIGIVFLDSRISGRQGPLGVAIKFFFVALFLGGITLSYARASLFVAVLVLFLYILKFKGKIHKLSMFLCISLLFVGMMISSQKATFVTSAEEKKGGDSLINNFSMILTPEYLTMLQTQRLAALGLLGPTIIIDKPFFGYSPAFEFALEKINNNPAKFFFWEWPRQTFKDVYWVAMLGFYGLSGLFCFAMIFIKNYRICRSCVDRFHPNSLGFNLGVCGYLLTVSFVVLLFFTQSFEFRQFSYYYWMIMGLIVSFYRKNKNIERGREQKSESFTCT